MEKKTDKPKKKETLEQKIRVILEANEKTGGYIPSDSWTRVDYKHYDEVSKQHITREIKQLIQSENERVLREFRRELKKKLKGVIVHQEDSVTGEIDKSADEVFGVDSGVTDVAPQIVDLFYREFIKSLSQKQNEQNKNTSN